MAAASGHSLNPSITKSLNPAVMRGFPYISLINLIPVAFFTLR